MAFTLDGHTEWREVYEHSADVVCEFAIEALTVLRAMDTEVVYGTLSGDSYDLHRISTVISQR